MISYIKVEINYMNSSDEMEIVFYSIGSKGWVTRPIFWKISKTGYKILNNMDLSHRVFCDSGLKTFFFTSLKLIRLKQLPDLIIFRLIIIYGRFQR